MKIEITNINKGVWQILKAEKDWWFAGICSTIIFGFIIYYFGARNLYWFFSPLLVFGLRFGIIAGRVRKDFWQQFAASQGFGYKETSNIEHESALFFAEGESPTIDHVIEGTIEGRKMRVFEYSFYGSGKSKRTHEYTVFAFQFDGAFPHLYLDQIKNSYGIGVRGERIPVPHDFEKDFTLYGPRKYEVEALAIFTPQVFAALLDEEWPHDIELVKQELLIFRDTSIRTSKELEDELERDLALMRLLAPALDRATLTQIGDYPHSLRRDSS